MDKIWYIKINNIEEGPYSFYDLKSNWRISPETLAWKEGFVSWLPIRDIEELKDLFKDEKQPEMEEPETKPEPEEEIALPLSKDPFSILFWVLITALLIFYIFYKYFL